MDSYNHKLSKQYDLQNKKGYSKTGYQLTKNIYQYAKQWPSEWMQHAQSNFSQSLEITQWPSSTSSI